MSSRSSREATLTIAGRIDNRPWPRRGGCSSVGRAPDCGSGGRGFETLHSPAPEPAAVRLTRPAPRARRRRPAAGQDSHLSTFVLVHGAWHGSWCWAPVVARLQAAGHAAVAFDLPGRAGDATPHGEITLESYARAI